MNTNIKIILLDILFLKRLSIVKVLAVGILINSQLLYQLSYRGIKVFKQLVGYISIEIYSPPFFLVKTQAKIFFLKKFIPNLYPGVPYFFYILSTKCKMTDNKGQLTVAKLINLSYNLCIIK